MRPTAILCSHNAHKAIELESLLSDFAIVALPPDFELPPETGETFVENARIKARAGVERYPGHWVIADDSGLCVQALGGAPGVHSARFAADGASDEENTAKLLSTLESAGPRTARAARFVCTLVAIAPDGAEFVATGEVHGTITTEPRGTGGFGYDPVFVPDGERATFAELGQQAKDAMSHRARAAAQLARTVAGPLATAEHSAAIHAKRNASRLSIGTAAALTLIKGVVAVLTGSVAVLSETVHSLTDLAASAIVWFSLRRAAHPPDRTHRYGHEKVENLSAGIEGGIILAASMYVVYRAVQSILDGPELQHAVLATVVMAVTGVINLVVALRVRKTARETDSPALLADAQQQLGDVYTSAAVVIGLVLTMVTGNELFDPAVALVVAASVVRIALQLIVGSARVLLDESLPGDELETISTVLSRPVFGVTGWHRLRTRKAGSRRHVDLHLTLDGRLTLERAHEIADSVEAALRRALPNTDVLIHIEPDTEAPGPGQDAGPSDRP